MRSSQVSAVRALLTVTSWLRLLSWRHTGGGVAARLLAWRLRVSMALCLGSGQLKETAQSATTSCWPLKRWCWLPPSLSPLPPSHSSASRLAACASIPTSDELPHSQERIHHCLRTLRRCSSAAMWHQLILPAGL